MKPSNHPDVGAGVMFIVIGALALWGARHLRVGTASAMGPGYFPTALALLLLALGAITLARAWQGPRVALLPPAVRTVSGILLAIVGFAIFLQTLGLFLSTIGLVVACRWAAGASSNQREVWLLGLVLGVAAVALFIYGLGVLLPIWPIWPSFVLGGS